jgi:hypothetical protein
MRICHSQLIAVTVLTTLVADGWGMTQFQNSRATSLKHQIMGGIIAARYARGTTVRLPLLQPWLARMCLNFHARAAGPLIFVNAIVIFMKLLTG